MGKERLIIKDKRIMTDLRTAENTQTVTKKTVSKERQFKGMSLAERKHVRREKLIEAGIETYGTQGFFAVTVKDVCQQAKLTERYFYESFKKSEDLFHTIFLRLIEQLQHTTLTAIVQASPAPQHMIEAGLTALLKFLKNDPRSARIIYIDAMLVQELHNQATISETMARFDQMIQAFIISSMPHMQHRQNEITLISTGLNGYVTQIAIRWVVGGFKQPLNDVLFACSSVFLSLLQRFSETSSEKENCPLKA